MKRKKKDREREREVFFSFFFIDWPHHPPALLGFTGFRAGFPAAPPRATRFHRVTRPILPGFLYRVFIRQKKPSLRAKKKEAASDGRRWRAGLRNHQLICIITMKRASGGLFSFFSFFFFYISPEAEGGREICRCIDSP